MHVHLAAVIQGDLNLIVAFLITDFRIGHPAFAYIVQGCGAGPFQRITGNWLIQSFAGIVILKAEELTSQISRRLSDHSVIYLLAPDGSVWDRLGQPDEFSRQPPVLGFSTVTDGDDSWRVYSEPVTGPDGAVTAWLQVAQEMEAVEEMTESWQAQMVLGLPLALLLAGFVGFFLAWRALAPIDRITRTAQTLNASDLSHHRLDYEGPADEVGRLAATFDAMLDRLQLAFERERRFTGDAAHELRTPLTALKGQIGVTLSRPRAPEAYTETLESMEQQVDRLIRLSNDLLFMARLDQGRWQLQRDPVELADLLGAVIDQVNPLVEAKQITLHHALGPECQVQGDMELLIRLFLNLLHNAVKYTPPGGRVTVTAQAADRDVLISVHDTGPGIAPEHLPHLFDRFYRAEADRSRGSEDNGQDGAGLGLAIAYEIARVHDGNLTVESIVGEGSTFRVRLPQANTAF
jgi:heavy metal sensor kinase